MGGKVSGALRCCGKRGATHSSTSSMASVSFRDSWLWTAIRKKLMSSAESEISTTGRLPPWEDVAGEDDLVASSDGAASPSSSESSSSFPSSNLTSWAPAVDPRFLFLDLPLASAPSSKASMSRKTIELSSR